MTYLLIVLALSLPQDSRPPLDDAERLPDKATTEFNRKIAEEHHDLAVQQLQRWGEGSPMSEYWGAVRRESYTLWDWWKMADIARDPSYGVERRRNYLDCLRQADPIAYYAGAWPPPVPTWRLPRVTMRQLKALAEQK